MYVACGNNSHSVENITNKVKMLAMTSDGPFYPVLNSEIPAAFPEFQILEST